MSNQTGHKWILLIHQLPPKPTNLRVRIWRKLQKLGAVAVKNSIYVLPANEKTYEDFQWLKQEIEAAGGEATVFRADSVQSATDTEIVAAFNSARNQEFTSLTAEFDGLTGAVKGRSKGKHLSAGRLAAHEMEMEKLHAELKRINDNDFFSATGKGTAFAAYERCQSAVRSAHGPTPKKTSSRKAPTTLEIGKFQGKRWATRQDLHIDRLATAWLIKQFIDKRPRFYFVAEGETLEGAIPFDMFGAEFSHHGEDCTFETMLKFFGLEQNKGLKAIAEIVHDIDLKDEKFNRLEAAGLAAIVDGLGNVLRDDRKLLQQTSIIFDGLHALLSNDRGQSNKKKAKR